MQNHLVPADLHFFVTLANAGSLSAAAHSLGVTPAAVSKRLMVLETRLGIPLVNRTTRRIRLTPEGSLLYANGRRILADIDDLDGQLQAERNGPRGLLRINSTFAFGRLFVAPAISAFCTKYSDVDVRMTLTEAPLPFAEDAFDIGIWFGEPPDSRVIAKHLGSNEHVLCASPAYLARHPPLVVPGDLRLHDCIDIQQGKEVLSTWKMQSRAQPEEPPLSMKIRGRLATNDGESAIEWSLAGLGVVRRARWTVEHHIQAGRLVQVLPDWHIAGGGIYALYAKRHQSSHRVRLFIDQLAEALSHD